MKNDYPYQKRSAIAIAITKHKPSKQYLLLAVAFILPKQHWFWKTRKKLLIHISKEYQSKKKMKKQKNKEMV